MSGYNTLKNFTPIQNPEADGDSSGDGKKNDHTSEEYGLADREFKSF